SYGDDTATIAAFGTEVISDMCQRPIAGAAPSLHFYTLNQAAPSRAIPRNLCHSRGVPGSARHRRCDYPRRLRRAARTVFVLAGSPTGPCQRFGCRERGEVLATGCAIFLRDLQLSVRLAALHLHSGRADSPCSQAAITGFI